ncbi:MAG: serpin family protein [Planctomycetaceae bacterium]|jgi:serpin B|nr:serpin family protein [Planctomycetaceae bacterium]
MSTRVLLFAAVTLCSAVLSVFSVLRAEERSVDAAAFAMFQPLIKEKPQENNVYSPLGVRLAMQLAYLGSDKKTAAEINTLFGFAADENFVPPKTLTVANAVWVKPDYKIRGSYLEAVKTLHAESMPFESVDPINAWVKEKTKGKISKLFENLGGNVKAVLTNALYFKDGWEQGFKETQTVDEDFHSISSTEDKVKMMHQIGNFRYCPQKNFACIQLEYKEPGTSMLVILPDEKEKFQDFCSKFGAAEFQKVLPSLRTKRVDLALPRFKAEADYQLIPSLKAAGIQEAFSDNADFSKMTEANDLKIGEVRQKVVLEVNEEGSEAAAATGVVMTRKSLPAAADQPVRFHADRPFLYILYDQNSKRIMFMGSYVKGH